MPFSSHSLYIGHCSKCDKLEELDTAVALCRKCYPTPKPKKETPNGG